MNKKTVSLLGFIVVLALATLACRFSPSSLRTVTGNGELTQEERSVRGFDKIEILGLGEITVELGEEESLTIEAEENLLPYLETYVSGNTLVIAVEEGRTIIPTKPVNFHITVVALDEVDVSGLGNISLPDIETDHFRIDISGAGNIDIDSVNADSLDVSMSGLGDLTVKEGQVSTQTVTISGSGKYSASKVECEDATITISGLGAATLRASQYLKVTISGGGEVNYYGNPEVDSDISGLGGLDRLGD